MEGFDTHFTGGSLQISSEVIEKIARHAAMEVEGVHDVAPTSVGSNVLLDKIMPGKAITVTIKNGVADVEVCLVVEPGSKIPDLAEAVQKNVKEAVQSMTSISVARVDVIVTGIRS